MSCGSPDCLITFILIQLLSVRNVKELNNIGKYLYIAEKIRKTGVTYSFFPHTHFSPRKNEYILSFPPEKNEYILRFSPRKNEYILNFPPENQVCVNTYSFFPHPSFPPSPILIGFFLCTLLYMYMMEDIIVKCGRKRVSTMIIVITKASRSHME